uniref:RING-type E3 ubiquitin transferase n=1 Tax=Melanopsichium pennsylvanicum 4 TaxID=1398559 RepID=A0A077R5K0_9BASI|nr:e3 ubiquitin ligase [Melanopsichium pennsylvanicum 4]
MHYSRSLALYIAVLFLFSTFTQASFISTLLWGKDSLDPIRAAIISTSQLRSQVHGWYTHNATQQANFTVTPDPTQIYSLLPSTYSARSLIQPDGSYFSDVQGYYKGQWTGWDFSTVFNRSLAIDSRLNRTAAQNILQKGSTQPVQYVDKRVNEASLTQDRGDFPWLAADPAHVDLHLVQEHLLPGNVSLITGGLTFSAPKRSKSKVNSVDLSLEGLHFLPTGTLFLHAVSDEAVRGTDVRTSLSMIPGGNNHTMNATIAAIDKAFQLRIDMLNRIIKSGSWDPPEAAEPQPLKHNCSLHVYGQFRSAGPYSILQSKLSALESEWRQSTGISTIASPPLQLSLTAFSPECQLLVTTTPTTLSGLLQSRLWKKAIHYAVIYFILLFIQTYLLVQQMEASTTPSGLAKVADKTWLAQSVLDAYACLIHLSVAVVLENETTKALLACSFMSAICFLAFGYRFTIVVYRSQMDAVANTTTVPVAVPALDAVATQLAPVEAASNARDQPQQSQIQQSNQHQTTSTNNTHANIADTNHTTHAPASTRNNLLTNTINYVVSADNSSATPQEIAARRRGATILFVGLFLVMVGFFPIFTITLILPFLSTATLC